MSELTPFGVTLRKLRLDKRMRLLDLADRLQLSVAFISAVETGRKAIPDGFVVKVGRAMELSAEQLRLLHQAADRTRKEVKVEQLPEDQRELVAAFARKLDEVPADMLRRLKSIVLKSTSGEIPFARKRRGIVVPAMSKQKIRILAEKVRSAFVDDDRTDMPIMDILEFKIGMVVEGFFLDVQGADVLGEDEGRVIAGQNSIILREDVYKGAWAGQGRHRFTACHELAHYIMHRSVTLARARDDGDKVFCDSEWQADTFAGTLMMSQRHLPRIRNHDEAAQLCNMSPRAAEVMWEKYQGDGLMAQSPPTLETKRTMEGW